MSEAIVMEVSNLKIDWFNEYLEIEFPVILGTELEKIAWRDRVKSRLFTRYGFENPSIKVKLLYHMRDKISVGKLSIKNVMTPQAVQKIKEFSAIEELRISGKFAKYCCVLVCSV